MPEQTYPRFKSWKDNGENVGVQCVRCTRTFWTGQEPATDPQTNEPCSNCQLIKDSGVLESENKLHREECLNPQKKDEIVCSHKSSQPDQL